MYWRQAVRSAFSQAATDDVRISIMYYTGWPQGSSSQRSPDLHRLALELVLLKLIAACVINAAFYRDKRLLSDDKIKFQTPGVDFNRLVFQALRTCIRVVVGSVERANKGTKGTSRMPFVRPTGGSSPTFLLLSSSLRPSVRPSVGQLTSHKK